MRRSFDHIARPYAFLERLTLGGALQRARCAHIDELPQRGRFLILGEGDGRFLQALLTARPHCDIDVVERSAAMLRLARNRNSGATRVRFFETDARQFAGPGPYDAIITLFFLDCFEGNELRELVRSLSQLAAPNATWLYADFAEQRAGLVGQLHRSFISALYRAFMLTTDIAATRLEDPLPYMALEGFHLVEAKPHDELKLDAKLRPELHRNDNLDGGLLSGGLLRSVVLRRGPDV